MCLPVELLLVTRLLGQALEIDLPYNIAELYTINNIKEKQQ